MIDVGGPSMLRAAAKNFAHVAPVCRPEQYAGRARASCASTARLSLETRRRLAREAFATTAAYEAAIARWFAERRALPRALHPVVREGDSTSRTARTRTSAPPTTRSGRPRAPALARRAAARQASSRSTTSTTSPPRACSLREFTLPACVIVKHANPCGVAVAATIEEAYDSALAADPLSAYGGIVVLNRPVSAPSSAPQLAEQFVEVLFAPGYDEVALEALSRKQAHPDPRRPRAAPSRPGERDYKRVLGGLLVQDRDWDVEDREGMDVVAGEPSEEQWGDLLFAWRVCKHVTLERDRDREGPADDRDRRRPDEPRRRRADRGREGARARPRPRRRGARLGRVLPLRRRPAARARRAASRRSSSRAARSATTRSSRRSRRRARRWSSPAAATSATRRTEARAEARASVASLSC